MTLCFRFPGLTSTCACLFSLLLFGCGGSGGRYPAGWPPLANKVTSGGCPDVTGTYLFDQNDPDYDATTFGVLSTFLGTGVTRVSDAPLLSFSVAGDASNALRITFNSARSATAESGKAPETPTTTASHGSAYTCNGGWLVGMPHDLHVTTPWHNTHGNVGPTSDSGTMGPQIARIRRDSEGGLVARANVREARIFSVWAETGAGIPYWFDNNTYWARWRTVNDTVEQSKINPATLSKIARQVYEMENGVGTYGAASSAAAPPSAAAAPVDMRSSMARHVDSSATLEEVRREGDRYVLTLRVTARGQVTRTMESLSDDTAFTDVQDHGIIASGNQKDLATLSFRRR